MSDFECMDTLLRKKDIQMYGDRDRTPHSSSTLFLNEPTVQLTGLHFAVFLFGVNHLGPK